ncbi:unnamed protein product [Prunus armeniaca]|uniref:Uncharacterized protein n=1 Tax=Prunus armeniaca TaxID=36596 RepID=A0A6J5VIZ9_PRUAR|nr:unnamed protein product [Prunus armeniaca]CAB4318451.1 unnamed protein product [Prunus armeniaca]
MKKKVSQSQSQSQFLMAFLNVNFGEVKHDDADGDDHDLFFTPLSSPNKVVPKKEVLQKVVQRNLAAHQGSSSIQNAKKYLK